MSADFHCVFSRQIIRFRVSNTCTVNICRKSDQYICHMIYFQRKILSNLPIQVNPYNITGKKNTYIQVGRQKNTYCLICMYFPLISGFSTCVRKVPTSNNSKGITFIFHVPREQCNILRLAYCMYNVGMNGSISKHEAQHKRHMHLASIETNLENVNSTFSFPFCTK